MAYSSPATVSDGNVAPATWGNSVKAATDFLANPPACRVFHNTTQSLTNNTVTAIAFNSERYDTDTMHDTVTNNTRITITTAGIYIVTGHVELTADTDFTEILLGVRLNGATSIGLSDLGTFDPAINPAMSTAVAYKFAAADYIELIVRQRNTSAGANTLRSSGNYSPEFAATWIGLG